MTVTVDDIIAVARASNIPGIATLEIEPEASFYEQGIDSLDALTIVLRIEEEYNVKIPDEDVERLDSIAALADYLNSLTVNAAG